jgi:Zn-dependent peptidase ImmA (M78 family)
MALSRLQRIETDSKRDLDFSDLGRLAAALGVTLGRLASSHPTQERVLAALRADGDEGDIATAVEQVCDIIDLDEGLNGTPGAGDRRPPLDDLLGPVKLATEHDPTVCGTEMARQLRTYLGLGDAPVGDLASLIENATGALVAYLPMPASVSVLCVNASDSGIAVIAANTVNTNAARQRFTLAHEFGHLLAGATHVDAKKSNSRPERLANAFAAELLMPVEGVRAWVDRAVRSGEQAPETSDHTIAMLLAAYGVSAPTAAIQLEHADLLGGARVDQVKELSGEEAAVLIGRGAEWESEEAIAATPRPPRRLWNRALSAYQEGIITLAPLARISGRPEAELAEEFARTKVHAERWVPPVVTVADEYAEPSPQFDLDDLLEAIGPASTTRSTR